MMFCVSHLFLNLPRESFVYSWIESSEIQYIQLNTSFYCLVHMFVLIDFRMRKKQNVMNSCVRLKSLQNATGGGLLGTFKSIRENLLAEKNKQYYGGKFDANGNRGFYIYWR